MRPAAIEKAAPMAAQANERECSREAVLDHDGRLLRIHYTDTDGGGWSEYAGHPNVVILQYLLPRD